LVIACETFVVVHVALLLQMQPFDSASHEARLESELKKALSEHRAESLGHTPTVWDDHMAYVLMSSLAGHEHEALTGQPAANHEDFQQCIKRSIPPGCMFKGSSQHHRWELGQVFDAHNAVIVILHVNAISALSDVALICHEEVAWCMLIASVHSIPPVT